MLSNSITFLSSRSRGMNQDLNLLKEYFLQNMENPNFRYFVKNELVKDALVKKGITKNKQNFYQPDSPCISIDVSFPRKKLAGMENGKRILLALPFDYQFEKALDKEASPEQKKLDTYMRYTDIFAFSPFTYDLTQNVYDTENNNIVKDICFPFAWEINQTERCKEVRETFEHYFPDCKGKRIISILTTLKRKKENEEYLNNFDLKEFLKKLDEDCFVFTNNTLLLEQAANMDAKYRKSFGFIDRVLPTPDLLYFTDTLITNHSIYASYFASKRKPIYFLEYEELAFEQYIKKHYPDLYVTAEELMEKSVSNLEMSNEQIKVCEMLSYAPNKDPRGKILNIVNN